MKGEITIALQFKPAIGDVTLDEIVCQLKEFRDDLMLRILGEILRSYDPDLRAVDADQDLSQQSQEGIGTTR